jgi:hypothetical protein
MNYTAEDLKNTKIRIESPEQELREYLSKLIVHSSKEICDTPLNNDDADFIADRLINKLSITKK